MAKWITEIDCGDELESTMKFSANSHKELETKITSWLIETTPAQVRSQCAESNVTHTITKASDLNPIMVSVGCEDDFGWGGTKETEVKSGYVISNVGKIQSTQVIEDIEAAYTTFVRDSIYITKDADWCDPNLCAENYHLVKSIYKTSHTEEINYLISKGWTVLSLERTGDTDRDHNVVNSNVTFVMGHDEEHASTSYPNGVITANMILGY
ncbi:hypothetical protein I8Y06_000558 [Photobacterium damselae]|nr:hypothetical protein [Photobacterium damselae]